MSPGIEDSSIFLQLRWQAVLFSSYQFSTNRQNLAGSERQKPLGSPHQHFRGEGDSPPLSQEEEGRLDWRQKLGQSLWGSVR